MPANSPVRTTGARVLISGASIAGPALAFWLHRYGFDVTVVERAGSIRGGGYPIDIRGAAVDVAERMGVLPELQAAHIDTRKLTFLDAEGRPLAAIRPGDLGDGKSDRDLEMPRGALASALFRLTQRQAIAYRFGDSIVALHDDGASVDVSFKSGERASFDLVIGADGQHSATRRLAFGPEAPFARYLGYCFNGFSVPNTLGLSHEGVVYAQPGRAAVLYAAGDSDRLHALLAFAAAEPPYSEPPEPDQQRRLTAARFTGDGWEVPRLVQAMMEADDLYYDAVSQIHAPHWSTGRVALVGDAAHAPSFLSGQGSSLALVGAYILAGELASHAGHGEAFAAYERTLRPFVEANRALAGGGAAFLLPRTSEELRARDQMLAALASSQQDGPPDGEPQAAPSGFRLPDYGVTPR